jgi:hypothetical protein
MSWAIHIRPATNHDIDALGASANTVDGAAAVEIWEPGAHANHQRAVLVAVCDEYGTAYVKDKHPLDTVDGKSIIEELVRRAMEVLAEESR